MMKWGCAWPPSAPCVISSWICPSSTARVSFATELAESGEEGLAALERGPLPDILLLDHMLGGMTGLDVLGRIAERKYALLAIMVTAYASLETAVHATKLGAFDFLAKPFTPDELRTVVRKAHAPLPPATPSAKAAGRKTPDPLSVSSLVFGARAEGPAGRHRGLPLHRQRPLGR